MAVQAGAPASSRLLTRTDGAGDGREELVASDAAGVILSGDEPEQDVLENGYARPGQGLNRPRSTPGSTGQVDGGS